MWGHSNLLGLVCPDERGLDSKRGWQEVLLLNPVLCQLQIVWTQAKGSNTTERMKTETDRYLSKEQ